MIAIPVKERGEEPLVSEIFAMSKWFAIVNGDTVTFEKNIYKSGIEVTTWLNDMGVKQVVANKIGSTTYEKLTNLNILCLYTDIKIKLTDIILKAQDNELRELNIQNCVFEKNCN